MDSRKWSLLLLWIIEVIMYMQCVQGNLVFEVQHKYGARGKALTALKELRAHDHRRMLSAVEFQLDVDFSTTKVGLYYTKITIGTPPDVYHVQVDTGSDLLWVACQNCENCPTKSKLKIPLNRYDLTASSTAQKVTCGQELCYALTDHWSPKCKVGADCEYTVTYGDGSQTEGYYVRDYFSLDRVIGDLRTSTMNGSIVFGCSLQESGELDSPPLELDGIIGFGASNTSIISQLALSGKVKKVFSHCLSSNGGGGIFAIGEVVEPKVKRTPLVPNKPHYNVFLEAIEVGGEFLNLTVDKSKKESSKSSVIDSGTALAYFPSEVYLQLIDKMMQKQPKVNVYTGISDSKCFRYHGNIDDGFPVIIFHVRNSVTLSVHPHDYLLQVRKKDYCIGWQNRPEDMKKSGMSILLGDIVLKDKLVVYDLETQTIGWMHYDCSSRSIKVRDEETGNAYEVATYVPSSGFFGIEGSLVIVLVFAMLIITAALLNVYYEC